MNYILSGLFAAVSGAVASMGLGGGAVLIIFLSVFMNMNQFKAQGINLLFFLPIALFTTLLNAYKKRIDYNTVLPISIGGIIGAMGGILLANIIGIKIISKFLGAAIIILGLNEIINGIKRILARRRKL